MKSDPTQSISQESEEIISNPKQSACLRYPCPSVV